LHNYLKHLFMNADKEIYHTLYKEVGYKQINIKGTSRVTLNKMDKGESNITLKTLSKICKETGVNVSVSINNNIIKI